MSAKNTVRPCGRERERESIPDWLTSAHKDTFSLISYRYRKEPDPDSDSDFPLLFGTTYPSLEFSFSFYNQLHIVTKNRITSEKILIFSDVILFFIYNGRTVSMPTAWSEGIPCLLSLFPLHPLPGSFPAIRAPPMLS